MTPTGNLGDVFAAHAGSERTAIVDLLRPEAPRTLSYRAFDRACGAMAASLAARGLGPGDRVAICAVNRREYLVALFGAMRAGCVPVMVNIKLPAESVRFIIADSGARLVFADGALAAGPGKAGLGGTPVVSLDDAGPGGYGGMVAAAPMAPYRPGPGEIAEQPYTSGSTGRPKGVLLDHHGQCWMIGQLVASRDLRDDDASVVSAPLYHKNALLAVKSALAAGGRIVLFARFDAGQYIRAIEEQRLTMLTGVPTMYALILQEEELLARTDLSSVRACSMGSAPASDTLLDSLARVFPGAALNLNYGITEGGPIMFSWKHPDGRPRPRMTVGYPLDGVELSLVDGPGPDQGALHVRSPGVMAGYHNLPEETAKRLRGGWLDTGDVLRRDAEGWYYFVGRVDDMFVTAGENIYPGVVESMLERHPEILQAVVVPAPSALKAHVPVAFVVPRSAGTIDEKAVKRHALANGPAYAHPRRVFFVDELPLSGTNKIDRRLLAARAAQATRQQGTP